MNCEHGGTQFNSYDGALNRYEEKYRPAVPAMPSHERDGARMVEHSRLCGLANGQTCWLPEFITAPPVTAAHDLSRKRIFSGTLCPAGRKRIRSVLGGHGPQPIPASAQPHLTSFFDATCFSARAIITFFPSSGQIHLLCERRLRS